ncbi:unnamed protein product [Calypogeia fissa]
MLQSLPESIGRLRSLRKLRIHCTNLGSVPEELGNLSDLEVLSFDSCWSIKSLPESLWHICSLRNGDSPLKRVTLRPQQLYYSLIRMHA